MIKIVCACLLPASATFFLGSFFYPTGGLTLILNMGSLQITQFVCQKTAPLTVTTVRPSNQVILF
jgi:hypothetical protein